ncbi:MAG: adenylate kinase [Acidimicrobiia bacterium]
MGSRVVIVGRQGAGKGTQAVRLADALGVPHLSTGDMLRAAAKGATELGMLARQYLERGELVPDEVVVGLVAECLTAPEASVGFVLDGFPRTLAQAESLDGVLEPRGVEVVVALSVPVEVVVARLSARRVCATCAANYSLSAPPAKDWRCDACGGPVVQRSDDVEEAIARRLALYDAETEPLIQFYRDRGVLVVVDGVGDEEAVFERVLGSAEAATAEAFTTQRLSGRD